MKKLLACLMGALMILTVAASPIGSTQIISEKPCKILIDDFYTTSLVDLMKATQNLGEGDTLYLYSQGPGGNAFVCLSMMNYLEELKAKGVYIIAEVMGLAASGNALVWLMGDERIVHEHDLVMLHGVQMRNPYGDAIKPGDMDDVQLKIYHTLNNKFRQLLLDMLRDTETVNEIMSGDNWYDGQEALDLGIATKLVK